MAAKKSSTKKSSPESECENLDAMTQTELRAIRHPKLVAYAQIKALAMSHRLKGDISKAVALEKQCDQIYEKLPKSLKW